MSETYARKEGVGSGSGLQPGLYFPEGLRLVEGGNRDALSLGRGVLEHGKARAGPKRWLNWLWEEEEND